MTISDFLLSRIAEDEDAARTAAAESGDASWEFVIEEEPISDDDWLWQYDVQTSGSRRLVAEFPSDGLNTAPGEHTARHDPARVLSECQAKRAIVEQAARATHDRMMVISEFSISLEQDREMEADDPGAAILRHLATIYSDHPDYDEEWRP